MCTERTCVSCPARRHLAGCVAPLSWFVSSSSAHFETLRRGLAVVSVAFEAPVATTLFGAAAFCLIGHGAQARRVTSCADLAETRWVPYRSPGPFLAEPPYPRLQTARLEGASRRRGSQGRVFATGNEGMHRDHSGNPARRNGVISASRSVWRR